MLTDSSKPFRTDASFERRPLLFSKHNDNLFSYNWPAGTAGRGYVPIGIGFVASAMTAAFTQDRIYKHLSRRYGTRGVPEYRLVLTQVSHYAHSAVHEPRLTV